MAVGIINYRPTSSETHCFQDYLGCNFHRCIVLCLSSIIHMIMLDCPAALVWNYLETINDKQMDLCGSPLDALPCSPSALPMPAGSIVDKVGALNLHKTTIIYIYSCVKFCVYAKRKLFVVVVRSRIAGH